MEYSKNIISRSTIMNYKLICLTLFLLSALAPHSLWSQGVNIPHNVVYGDNNTVYVFGSSAATDGTMKLVAYAIDDAGNRNVLVEYQGQASILPAGLVLDGDDIIVTGTESNSETESSILTLDWLYELVSVEALPGIADGFNLQQSYPNPVDATGEAIIRFSVPLKTDLRLSVTDIRGREVALLTEGSFEPGNYSTRFIPNTLPAGTYFYVLSSARNAVVKKLLVTR